MDEDDDEDDEEPLELDYYVQQPTPQAPIPYHG